MKMMASKALIGLAPFVFWFTSSLAGQELPWGSLGEKLVERMQLQPGERVLLVAQPGRFDSLIAGARRAVRNAGGVDLGVLAVDGPSPDAWATDYTTRAGGKTRRQLIDQFQNVDVAVMLPGATLTHAPYAAMQDILRSGRSRTIHFHWAGAYDMYGSQLPVTGVTDRVYAHAVLATDYPNLAAMQLAFEQAMRGSVVRVTTPEGTDITFEIGNRPVTKQDGNASARRAAAGRNLIDREIELPAGAIRVAPLEASVNGTIAFPDADWNGSRVRGLVMRFERGRLVDFSAREGRAAVESELHVAGAAGRAFREFALGFNPLLAMQDDGEAWIPYYGYGAGVVRLSLGDNTELGGTVSGGYVRWNFFPNATVSVGSEIWVRDGQLVTR